MSLVVVGRLKKLISIPVCEFVVLRGMGVCYLGRNGNGLKMLISTPTGEFSLVS